MARVTAYTIFGKLGVSKLSDVIVTLGRNSTLGPPTNITASNLTFKNKSFEGKVVWEPSEGIKEN